MGWVVLLFISPDGTERRVRRPLWLDGAVDPPTPSGRTGWGRAAAGAGAGAGAGGATLSARPAAPGGSATGRRQRTARWRDITADSNDGGRWPHRTITLYHNN